VTTPNVLHYRITTHAEPFFLSHKSCLLLMPLCSAVVLSVFLNDVITVTCKSCEIRYIER
jgi:hypothetical protein